MSQFLRHTATSGITRTSRYLLALIAITVGPWWPGSGHAEVNPYLVPINKSRVIDLPRPVNRISVGNPGVADIRLLDPRHLYILGVALGSTNVSLGIKGNGDFHSINIEVSHDLDGLKAKLHQLMPNEHPKVYSSQGSIVLAGEVSGLDKMDAIVAIAKTYVHKGEKPPVANQGSEGQGGAQRQAGSSAQAPKGQETDVINLMQVGGPQQVMLEVKVAEMNRTLAKNLNVDFSALDPGGRVSAGILRNDSGGALIDALTDAIEVAPGAINPAGLFGRFISNDVRVSAVINAAREHGLAKILAEPTLTTISGQEASFLSGGEFPIPVGQDNDTITIEFKEFGVGVKFVPVVLDSGRISLKLNIDVSELTNSNTVTSGITGTDNVFVIPSLTKRRANSSVELADGQTIGIAGLISDNLRDSINKFPGLGEVPVLGQLFTSQEFQKSQTELVIFVTPRLARPMPTSRPKLPTDRFVEPDDVDFYLLGRTESRYAPRGGASAAFGQEP